MIATNLCAHGALQGSDTKPLMVYWSSAANSVPEILMIQEMRTLAHEEIHYSTILSRYVSATQYHVPLYSTLRHA